MEDSCEQLDEVVRALALLLRALNSSKSNEDDEQCAEMDVIDTDEAVEREVAVDGVDTFESLASFVVVVVVAASNSGRIGIGIIKTSVSDRVILISIVSGDGCRCRCTGIGMTQLVNSSSAHERRESSGRNVCRINSGSRMNGFFSPLC